MLIVLLLAGALLVVSSSTRLMLLGYMMLASTACTLSFPAVTGSAATIGLFILILIVKLGVVPAGILSFVRKNPQADDLRSSGSVPARLLLTIAFAIAARIVAHATLFASIENSGFIAFTLLCSLGTLLVHRNLLSHVLGLLALGAAVTLAGPALVPGFPATVELGVSFDALVAVFIGLALMRAFLKNTSVLDVENLRELHG